MLVFARNVVYPPLVRALISARKLERKNKRANEKNEVNENLSPSAQEQWEQKDRKKQRQKMVKAKKAKTKEAFAALKVLKEKKNAEANAVNRSVNTVHVERPDAVAAHGDAEANSTSRKRKSVKQFIGPRFKRVRYANLLDRTDDNALIMGYSSDSDDDPEIS